MIPSIKWTRQPEASLKKLELHAHWLNFLLKTFEHLRCIDHSVRKRISTFDRTDGTRSVYQQFPSIFPTPETETENRVTIVSDHGSPSGFKYIFSHGDG